MLLLQTPTRRPSQSTPPATRPRRMISSPSRPCSKWESTPASGLGQGGELVGVDSGQCLARSTRGVGARRGGRWAGFGRGRWPPGQPQTTTHHPRACPRAADGGAGTMRCAAGAHDAAAVAARPHPPPPTTKPLPPRPGDIKKAKDAGYHTIRGLLMNTKRAREGGGGSGGWDWGLAAGGARAGPRAPTPPLPAPNHPSTPPTHIFLPKKLADIRGLSEAKVEKMVDAAKSLAAGFAWSSAADVERVRTAEVLHISTGAAAVDAVLGGGIETKARKRGDRETRLRRWGARVVVLPSVSSSPRSHPTPRPPGHHRDIWRIPASPRGRRAGGRVGGGASRRAGGPAGMSVPDVHPIHFFQHRQDPDLPHPVRHHPAARRRGRRGGKGRVRRR